MILLLNNINGVLTRVAYKLCLYSDKWWKLEHKQLERCSYKCHFQGKLSAFYNGMLL